MSPKTFIKRISQKNSLFSLLLFILIFAFLPILVYGLYRQFDDRSKATNPTNLVSNPSPIISDPSYCLYNDCQIDFYISSLSRYPTNSPGAFTYEVTFGRTEGNSTAPITIDLDFEVWYADSNGNPTSRSSITSYTGITDPGPNNPTVRSQRLLVPTNQNFIVKVKIDPLNKFYEPNEENNLYIDTRGVSYPSPSPYPSPTPTYIPTPYPSPTPTYSPTPYPTPTSTYWPTPYPTPTVLPTPYQSPIPTQLCFVNPDTNGDNAVNFEDLVAWLIFYRQQNMEADINCDGQINFDDLVLFLTTWRRDRNS